MSLLKPRLISFDLCPFVQRSVITLIEKNIDFTLDYIDLANKPDWFLKISPLGKVPVVEIEETVLFESAVINEYLEEVYPPALHSLDPLQKAKDRAWIEFGSNLIMNMYMTSIAQNEESYNESLAKLRDSLIRLEEQLSVEGPYFNGSKFMLIDAALAPAYQRLSMIHEMTGVDIINSLPRSKVYANAIMARPSVTESVIPTFKEKYASYLQNQNSFLMQKTHAA